MLEVEQWHKWEEMYKEFLKNQTKLSPNEILIGYEDENGRVSYSQTKGIKKEIRNQFNELDYIIPYIVDRKYVDEMPSLAYVMPNANIEYLKLHPYENNEEDIDSIIHLFDELEEIDYGICILDSETINLSHGIAYIAWKKENQNHFAFYDPLSYKKQRTRNDTTKYFVEYDYAFQVLNWIKEVMLEEYSDFDLVIHDLSIYCEKRNEFEFDCPQYHMNAEYCYFYSLHFLYTWAGLGCHITPDGFEKAIIKSYIIDRNKLNRKYNLDTMYYKIIMFSFIVTVFIKYFEGLDKEQKGHIKNIDDILDHLNKISIRWYDEYKIPLLVV